MRGRTLFFVPASSKRQQGTALIIFMTIVVLIIASAVLTRLNASAVRPLPYDATAKALSEAKQALVGYALSYAEGHPGQPQGYLPCPDMDGDGVADAGGPLGRCSGQGTSHVGRLPWRTLGVGPLRDAAGECLWYAVSGNYKAWDKLSTGLTPDTPGQFEIRDAIGYVIAGSNPAAKTRAIALVFSPGSVLQGQDRAFHLAQGGSLRTECGSTDANDPGNLAWNFLDQYAGIDNAQGTRSGSGPDEAGSLALPTSTPAVFLQSSPIRDPTDVSLFPTVVFNDTVIAVTPEDLRTVYARMDRWVGERVRRCIDGYAETHASTYGVRKYPWASRLNVSGSFSDTVNGRFGRVPDSLASTKSSDATMSEVWPQDPMDVSRTCFQVTGYPADYAWWWWTDWQWLVFYGVDAAFAPGSPGTGSPSALSVDATLAEAVVLVAGRGQGQPRSSYTNAERADVANYLETDNQPSSGFGAVPPGDELFVSGPKTGGFNDIACDVTVGCK